MSKKNKYFSDFEEDLAAIREEKRKIEKKERKIMIRCSHQSRKGKLKIEPIDEKGNYRCRKCGAVFNMNKISEGTLEDASNILVNALQQVRCFADVEDDYDLIKLLGDLIYNLKETNHLYRRMVDLYDKGNKKKHKREYEDFGRYGTGALSFMSDKKKK